MLDRMTGELEDVAMDRQTKNFALRPVAGALIQQGNGKRLRGRSEEHTSELQSLMRISYAVFCLKKKKKKKNQTDENSAHNLQSTSPSENYNYNNITR